MRTERSPRRVALVFALAIGAALGFGGYHALRAIDLAEASVEGWAPEGTPVPID